MTCNLNNLYTANYVCRARDKDAWCSRCRPDGYGLSLAYSWCRIDSRAGLGIAFVSALRAKVPVLLHDRSSTQIDKGLALMDKRLAKDVAKGRISQADATEARERVTVVGPEVGLKGLRDVDMVVEVRGIAWILTLLHLRALQL